MRYMGIAATGALLLAGCMTNAAARHELAGKSLRVELTHSDPITVLFNGNGRSSPTSRRDQ